MFVIHVGTVHTFCIVERRHLFVYCLFKSWRKKTKFKKQHRSISLEISFVYVSYSSVNYYVLKRKDLKLKTIFSKNYCTSIISDRHTNKNCILFLDGKTRWSHLLGVGMFCFIMLTRLVDQDWCVSAVTKKLCCYQQCLFDVQWTHANTD